jgi:Protein of unknown function (DUF2764)
MKRWKWWSNSYHMLISSLPALPPHFDVERLPISFERLQGRLRMLKPEDAEEIERLLAVLRWANQFEEPNDAAVVQRYDALMHDITNPLVRDILAYGMDVRMIEVALRSRRRGLPLPTVGIGQWFDHIRYNFHQPDFRLGQVFPWIPEAERLLAQGDLLTLYRHVLGATWTYLKKRAEDYYFSFEAVVLYIARWDIIRRWQQLQAERGRAIFATLVTEALGEYANIYS